MRKLLHYLNPIAHLGETKYSIIFALLFSISISVLSEAFSYGIAKNPEIVGAYIIFINVAYIIYFAFRDGIRGGFAATLVTIFYYLYIIHTRNYSGQRLITALETTAVLAFLYLALAYVIGWLKQTIDQLIESEANEKQRLQTIVQQLPVGIVIVDSSGKIIHANKQIEVILGRSVREGFIVGKDTITNATYNGKPVQPTQWPLSQALTTGKAVMGKEFVIHREDGKRIYVQINASAVRNKKEKIIAAASIISDITQQKEMEERKDDFVNIASHELKTPITSMKLYIDSLINRMKNHHDERIIKTLHSVKNQTQKLQELVNDLLDVSRLQTGKLSFTKELFRIDSLIEEVIDDLQETSKHDISFTRRIPTVVYADKFRIYQVVTNLITNAIKYSPEGKNINVKIQRSNGKILVSVQDFGIGIEKKLLNKIFERLYQVTDDKGKTFPGFGMGLYISKEIIKRHKGRIWVESEKGQGSTFYFNLPVQKQ